MNNPFKGYPRGGPGGFGADSAQQGYPRGGPAGDRLGGDDEFNGYADNRVGGDDEEVAGAIPGRAGVDYPNFDTVPETSFKCDQQEFPGYYADPEAQCQVTMHPFPFQIPPNLLRLPFQSLC
jgi:hypothetical protein